MTILRPIKPIFILKDRDRAWRKSFYKWEADSLFPVWTKDVEPVLIEFDKEIFLYYLYIYNYILKFNYRSNINLKTNELIIYKQLTIQNMKNNKQYQYYLVFFLLKLKDLLFFLHLEKKGFFLNYIKSNEVFIALEFFKKKIDLYSYNTQFFLKINNIILSFFPIKVRVHISFFLNRREYVFYFKLVKYDEYLKQHPNIHRCYILKQLLSCRIAKRKYKLHLYFKRLKWVRLVLYKNMQIYSGKFKYKSDNKQYKLWAEVKHIKTHHTIPLLKIMPLIDNKYIYFNTTIFNTIYFYLYLYNILLFVSYDADWQELVTWRPNSFHDLYWQVNRYGFFVEWWVYTHIYLNILKMYKLKCYIFLNILIKKNKLNLNFNTICWYLAIKMILVLYIKKLYFKYYFHFVSLKKLFRVQIFKLMFLLLKAYKVFGGRIVKIKDHKELRNHFLNNKLTLDLMIWRVCYTGHYNRITHTNMNLVTIVNKWHVDKTIRKTISEYNQNIILYLNHSISKEKFIHDIDNSFCLVYTYLLNIFMYIYDIYNKFSLCYYKKNNYYIIKANQIKNKNKNIRYINIWRLKLLYFNFYLDNKKDMFDYNIEGTFLLMLIHLFLIRYDIGKKLGY